MSNRLATTADAAAAPAAAMLPERAERRQLTMLFCDLVDSVALSTRLDPEDLRDLISAYQQGCAQSVRPYDGYIARYVGDGVLVYFGYPTAHEDNAERAICAGLDIVAAVGRLPESRNLGVEPEIRVRIGIATGVVVVGDAVAEGVLDRDSVVGEAANLAARLQGLAAPNTIVVSPVTRQLAGERFSYRDLGQHEIKGFANPIAAYQVIERREVTRLQARGGALTPLVGRDAEIALMLERWRRAAAGNGQVVALFGQPGIGKSRITAEILARIGDASGSALAPIVLQYAPYHANAPLYPVVRYIAQLARIGPQDLAAVKLAKLATVLGGDNAAGREDLSLIADLLGIEEREPPQPRLNPAARRHLAIETLANHFADCSKREPVVVVVEDAQWIDPTSKLLLARLVNWARSNRAFLVITSRTDGGPGLADFLRDTGLVDAAGRHPEHVTTCEIRELPPRDGRRLAAAIAEAGVSLEPAQLEAVLAKSGGIPLYIEELARAAAKGFDILSARGSADPGVVPDTISDALMAQLDRLGSAKDVALRASVIGQEFPLGLLAEVAHQARGDLARLLDSLIEAGVVVAAAGAADSYRFKHALVRDIAYRSLLRRNRRQIHCAVAHALSRETSMTASNDLIAQHYSLGGVPGEAIAFWQRGAAQAIARSANEEAIAMLAAALAELRHIDAARQPALELDLVLAQAAALRSVRGYSAAEVEQRLARARQLSALCGDAETKFSVEWSLFLCTFVKGDIEAARASAAGLLQLAGDKPGPHLVDALLANGMVANVAGDFTAACQFHQAGAELSRPDIDEPRFLTHGQNAGLFCLSYLARSQCLLGRLGQGRATIERARAIAAGRAHDPGHIHSCLNVAIHAIRVYHLCGDLEAERRFAEEVVEIARQNRYAYYEALGLCHLGWVAGAAGDVERGIAMLREGMAGLSETGTFLSVPGFYLMLAQLQLRADNLDEASRSLAMAVGSKGFALWDADIERVRGDILARRTQGDAAVEAAYRSSLEIGRRQRAGVLVCKTGVSFARFLCANGRRQEGYELLKECLAPIEGGDDVPVVQQQARKLMDALAATA